MIRIAIDGPSGAGKSSVAKAIAKKLGIIYVDTGALYRTIGYYALCSGFDSKDKEAVISLLPSLSLSLKFEDGEQRLYLGGEEVSDKIRTPEVSMAASAVSAIPEVRNYLLALQRNLAIENDLIMDGRDIGTVIFPEAEVKIFLTASPEARASRRFAELVAAGQTVTFDKVLSDIKDRDHNDSSRPIAPLIPADDAILLDNSMLDFKGTVRAAMKIIKEKTKKQRTYKTGKALFSKPVLSLFGVKVFGLENIPEKGGVLFCSNHIGIRDVFIIAAASHRPIHFIAKKELFKNPLVGNFITTLGAIEIDREGSDVGAIKRAVNCVTAGEVVAVFPQGHRQPAKNPADTKIHNGVALMAYHAKCPCVPICIKVKGVKYGLFKRVELYFGKPITNEELGFVNGGSEEYRVAGKRIFDEILALGGYSSGSEI